MDTRPTADPWPTEEENYLKNLAAVSEMLSKRYRRKFEKKKKEQARFRIPSIVIGSISGVASFGTSTFPLSVQPSISIAVGCSAIFIAILNAIESYMKIGEIMGASLHASNNFHKLADDIIVELSVPPEHRSSQSIIFVRDVYASYQKYIDLAPPLKTIKIVNPGEDIAAFLGEMERRRQVTSLVPEDGIGTMARARVVTQRLVAVARRLSNVFLKKFYVPPSDRTSASVTTATNIEGEHEIDNELPLSLPNRSLNGQSSILRDSYATPRESSLNRSNPYSSSESDV